MASDDKLESLYIKGWLNQGHTWPHMAFKSTIDLLIGNLMIHLYHFLVSVYIDVE